jgi:hypothetical protein
MRLAAIVLSLLILLVAPAGAQVYSSLYSSSSVLPGSFTVATLPDPAANKARYAFVSDLGGGADMALSDGTYWKHIRQGVETDVVGGGPITITPLVSPPIMRVTGTGLASTSITITTANLYLGATFRIIVPGSLAALATFGIQVAGTGTVLGQLGATWQDVQWNGTQLIKIAGGSL